MSTANERCGCGASLMLTDNYDWPGAALQQAIKDFRVDHIICRKLPVATVLEDSLKGKVKSDE